MTAHIRIVPAGTRIEAIVMHMVVVMIGDETAAITPCPKQAEHIAMLFNRARESRSKHAAMNILTEQLHYSEEWASRLYDILVLTHMQEASNHAGSNAFN